MNYATLNPISKIGTDGFSAEYRKVEDLNNADIALVRSASMHDLDLPKGLLAVARAGAGVNNIPLEKCAEQGIVVFNTPGANANGVKELVLAGMLLAARDITGGIAWTEANKEDPEKPRKKRRNSLPVPRSQERNSGSSVLVPLASVWLTLRRIWIWMYMVMILISRCVPPGVSPNGCIM